ncbi:MAG: lysylphosphatidylglycerol synthase domain-containing protein [Cyanobium sp.]
MIRPMNGRIRSLLQPFAARLRNGGLGILLRMRSGLTRPTSASQAAAAGPRALRLAGWKPSLPGGLRSWITLVSLGFLLAALTSHGRQLLQLGLDGQGWLWLLIGLGLCLLSVVVNGVAWSVLLRWLGQRPQGVEAVAHYMVTNLRKFLPGGIWHLTARLQDLRRGQAGLPAPLDGASALLAVVLEPVLAASAALALAAVGGWQGGLGLLGLLPLALLLPRWLSPLLGQLERRKAKELQRQDPMAAADGPAIDLATVAAPTLPGYPWQPLLAEAAFVLLRFAGFACCVWAFDLQLALGWPVWLAGFAQAWTAGLVVPGAPGGLGVFEAVLLLRLGGLVPAPQLLAVALSYRLLTTAGDLLAALLADLDNRRPLGASAGPDHPGTASQ